MTTPVVFSEQVAARPTFGPQTIALLSQLDQAKQRRLDATLRECSLILQLDEQEDIRKAGGVARVLSGRGWDQSSVSRRRTIAQQLLRTLGTERLLRAGVGDTHVLYYAARLAERTGDPATALERVRGLNREQAAQLVTSPSASVPGQPGLFSPEVYREWETKLNGFAAATGLTPTQALERAGEILTAPAPVANALVRRVEGDSLTPAERAAVLTWLDYQ